ncbi:hypothetical protein ACHAXR_008941 [Thalassiosira sp. AJA248-18]
MMVQHHQRHHQQPRLLVGAVAGVLATLLGTASAFTSFTPLSPPPPPTTAAVGRCHRSSLLTAAAAASPNEILVISPPGGIGEITSIEAARLGGSVKWFVVSAPSSSGNSATTNKDNNNNVALTAETLAAIEKSGGSMELAGAAADSLLVPSANDNDASSSGTNSALAAMASWCSSSNAGGGSSSTSVICTYDGATEEKRRVDRFKTPEERESGGLENNNEVELIRSGIRVAAREAVRGGRNKIGDKIALLAAGEEMMTAKADDDDKGGGNNGGGGGGFFAGLFGGNEMEVPDSLAEAMDGTTAVIRYGELFGAPESSPESSPFMGGPRRDPTVRDMYTMRSVRIDPTVSGGDSVSKSNRLALGEAASRFGLGKVGTNYDGNNNKNVMMDVSLSSFAGTDTPTNEEWEAQFNRVTKMMTSSSTSTGGGGVRLFAAEFSSVPSTKRLAEWLATKWAPAIMRSYDIAGTRVGARPVYALQTSDATVEIVWQELVDFTSVTSGKMVIEVEESGMVASRGAGDASKGFGSISMVPLPGEDILVRRLADAASQAVEKGLAVKHERSYSSRYLYNIFHSTMPNHQPQLSKKTDETAKKPVTTVVAAAESSAAPAAPTSGAASGPGPRSAGARRSSERSRGSRRRATPPPPPESGEES